MTGEEELFEMFEDLEAQAEAIGHLERVVEVADRTRTEYGTVTLDARLMASLEQQIEVDVLMVGPLTGEVARVGPGWFQLVGPAASWWIRTVVVSSVRMASDRAVPEVAWSPVHRLSLNSVMRGLADQGVHVLAHLLGGSRHEGRIARVGADFFELEDVRGVVLVPLGQVTAIRRDRTP